MATQSEAQTGDIKKFIDAFNAELEKVYTKATTDLGPWKKAREEAVKITKPRMGTWPVDPAVKTIGDLFAYVFFDPDGVKYKIPPYYVITNGVNAYVDDALKQQYGDWIDDMNGVSSGDPSIGVIFKSLASDGSKNWTGDEKNSTQPIRLSDSAQIIQNYNEIKKPGITNPDKYSAGQWWFDVFMSDVVGLDGLSGYLKSSKWVDDEPAYKGLKVIWGSNNSRIEEIFSSKLLDNNKKIEKSFSYWGNIGDGTYSDPVYEDKEVYTISVSKFVKGETVPFPIIPYEYDRHNYSDYGTERTADSKGYGFAKILQKIDGGGYGGFDIRDFDGLKTQYRPGVNSIETLIKDPLFNPYRTSNDIEWDGTGTQSQETGIYWNYYIDEGKTASVVGNFELISLYDAFLEAGDNYQTITLPKKAPEPKVETPVVSTLVPTTESKLSGEFTFNVEKKDTFVVVGNQNFALKIGDLVIEGLTTSSTPVIESPKTIDLGDGIIMIDDGESEGEDIYYEELFTGSEELAQDIERIKYEQNQLPPDTPASTLDMQSDNIDLNDPSFKGEAWKNFDISVAVNKINETDFKVSSLFAESLKKVLYFIKNDEQIKDIREASYLLGTAYAESGYSLQRWEADYACKSTGVKYGPNGPCSAATNYYKSTDGKLNYYTLGLDSKNQCYFGRGLIQLTGKDNYKTYGEKIGVDLLSNGDLAIDPVNSYKIASVYMRGRTFKYVLDPNAKFTTKYGSWSGLEAARRSVNGGTKELDKINRAYKSWLTVIKESKSAAV